MTQTAERRPHEPFTHEADVERALDEFFRWPERKVLMLKGPWGSGKSYYLREVYLPNRRPNRDGESLLPGKIAYVSVFGCRTVREVEERILACLHPLKNWGKPEPGKWWKRLTEIAKQTNITFHGVKLALPASAALWGLARVEDALIVIDDIERADDDLEISEILGLVSGMTENAKGNLKVILVCNTEKLANGSADELGELREKAIYTELLYNPVLEEIVDRFFTHKKDSHVMLECLRVIKEGNIRIIRRVAEALTQIVELLEKNGAVVLEEDRGAIIRLSVFFFRAGIHVDGEWIAKRNTLYSKGKEKHPEILLMKQLKAGGSDLDDLTIEWLSHGVVNDSFLMVAVEKLKHEEYRQSFYHSQKEAWRLFHDNFLCDDVNAVAKPILDHLRNYAGMVGLNSVASDLGFLEEIGVDVKGVFDQHVELKAPNLDIENCQSCLGRNLSEHARRALEARLRELRSSYSIKEVISKITKDSSWSPEDVAYLSSITADMFADWLRTETASNTVEIATRFLALFRGVGEEMQGARSNLENAIRALARESIVHRARAKHLFNLDFK